MSGQSRLSMLEMKKALNSVYNPKDSAFGNALLKGNKLQDRLLKNQLIKLESQLYKKQQTCQTNLTAFLRAKNQKPSPVILVERKPKANARAPPPPPPLHNYMKELQSRQRQPSKFGTIDMCRVKSRHKMNIWTECLKVENDYEFLTPGERLTEGDKRILNEICRAKMTPNSICGGGGRESTTTDDRDIPTHIRRLLSATGRLPDERKPIIGGGGGAPKATFITQLDNPETQIDNYPILTDKQQQVKFQPSKRRKKLKKLQTITNFQLHPSPPSPPSIEISTPTILDDI